MVRFNSATNRWCQRRVQEIKFLSMTIDEKISWKSHMYHTLVEFKRAIVMYHLSQKKKNVTRKHSEFL